MREKLKHGVSTFRGMTNAFFGFLVTVDLGWQAVVLESRPFGDVPGSPLATWVHSGRLLVVVPVLTAYDEE